MQNVAASDTNIAHLPMEDNERTSRSFSFDVFSAVGLARSRICPQPTMTTQPHTKQAKTKKMKAPTQAPKNPCEAGIRSSRFTAADMILNKRQVPVVLIFALLGLFQATCCASFLRTRQTLGNVRLWETSPSAPTYPLSTGGLNIVSCLWTTVPETSTADS